MPTVKAMPESSVAIQSNCLREASNESCVAWSKLGLRCDKTDSRRSGGNTSGAKHVSDLPDGYSPTRRRIEAWSPGASRPE